LDDSSRTSAVLLKIIFKEFINSEPEWESSSGEFARSLRSNDAALVIGDPAMTLDSEGLNVFDLATLWHEHTGLGFIFAMWMAPVEKKDVVSKIDFHSVRDYGLDRIQEIADEYTRVIPLHREDLLEYLTENISYNADENLRSGLDYYFELAHKHKLIETVIPLMFTSL
jgi:chorismate dehydratase